MFLFFGLCLGWPGGVLPGAAGGLGLGLGNLGNVSASRDVAGGSSVHSPIRARPPLPGRTAQYD